MATDAAIKRLLDASQDGLEGRLTMTQQLPTWNDIASYALTSLDEAPAGAQRCPGLDGLRLVRRAQPLDHAKRHEAAHLIREAEQLIDGAKAALHASGERVA